MPKKRQLGAWSSVGSAWKASRASGGVSFRYKKNTKACESRPDFDSELLDIKTSAEGASVVVVQSFSSSKVQILFQPVPFFGDLLSHYIILSFLQFD